MRSIGDLFWLVIAPAVLVAALLSLELPRELPVLPYQDGVTPLYLDRPYANAAANPALAGQRVVQLPRHLRFPVELTLSAPARVLRLLSEENENAPFAGWAEDAALRIAVPGRSAELTRAVARELAPGTHRLPPGGPVAATPILVASTGEVRARTTHAWNKLAPAASGSALDFVLGNERKLAALALGWAAWAAAAWQLRRRRPAR